MTTNGIETFQNDIDGAWIDAAAFIIDGSVLKTDGVVNLTLTLSALALRAAGFVRDDFAALSGTIRPRVAA